MFLRVRLQNSLKVRFAPKIFLFHFLNLHPGGIIWYYIKVGQIALGWLWWAISVFQEQNPSFLPYLCRAVARVQMIKIFHQPAHLPLFRHTSDCYWQKKIFENFYLIKLFPLNCAVDAQNGDVPPICRNFFLRHQILHTTGIDICKICDGLFWFWQDISISNFQNRIFAIFIILLPISH